MPPWRVATRFSRRWKMVRPKGGRAQPRYWHLKDAAEEKVAQLMGRQTKAPKRISPVDALIAELHHADAQVTALIERVELSLMVSALMNPTVHI